MMKRTLLIIAAAAGLLAACNVVEDNAEMVEARKAPDQAVNFGVYVNRGVATKAGWAGELTTAALMTSGDGNVDGFGVFGYYTNGELYSETARPDFMYNEKITWDEDNDVWTYSPIKYWPNEHGANAVSEDVDRLSFFAYAPYVPVTASTGVVTGDASQGIIGLSRNSATGDPMVKYVAAMTPGAAVDLCWGVDAETGEPNIDMTKQNTTEKVSFAFKHALASLNVQIDADIDKLRDANHADEANAIEVDAFTKVYVRSVTFEGFATKGALNLNSNANAEEGPNWYDLAGTGKLTSDVVTVYDGRRDGKEAVSQASSETPTGLNAAIIQTGAYTTTANAEHSYMYATAVAPTAGVTKTAVNLFDVAIEDPDDDDEVAAALAAPIYVIPTNEELKVTIVYDVETADGTLSTYLSDGKTHGSSVSNAISKSIYLDGVSGDVLKLEAGKRYELKLHLGLTSVKFEAVVTAWDDTTSASTDVNLPANNPNE